MKRLWGLMIILMLAIFLAACGNEERDGDEVNAEEETEDTAKEEEAEEESQEPAVPEDEELFAVLEENLKALEDKDLENYMNTMHPDSPAYAGTEAQMEQLFVYTLDLELSGLSVEEKTEEEARVSYEQTSIKTEGPVFNNNRTTGVHVLKPHDGVWKIYNTEVGDIVALDEEGNEMEQGAEGAAVMEGQYADMIMQLDIPFEGEGWELSRYVEQDGEAVADFIVSGEDPLNSTKLFSIHYFQEGNLYLEPAELAALMEEELANLVSVGELDFQMVENDDTQAIYNFEILGDDIHIDQEEIARVFVKGSDLYNVRYTTMGESMEEKEQWIENLKSIQ